MSRINSTKSLWERYSQRDTYQVKSEKIDGWWARGFFTPQGFAMLVPGVEPEHSFEREMLLKDGSSNDE